MSRYLIGVDVLGALSSTPLSPQGAAVVVRLKDVGAVVRDKGGAAGGLAYSIAPQSIQAKVYQEIRQKLADGLQKEGVDADVQVVVDPPVGPRPRGELLLGAALGAGAIALGLLARSMIRRK